MTKRYKYVKIRTRNYTASPLRNKILSNDRPIVFRMGSTTPTEVIFPSENPENVIEINNVEACEKSSNKSLMKVMFDFYDVKTAKWEYFIDVESDYLQGLDLPGDLRYPLIIKHVNSSKGIYYIKDDDDLQNFINHGHVTDNYIVENYHTFSKEYRLHVTNDGCFYTCRKMLKANATDRWHRHDSNSVWIMEENPLFDKPIFWDEIVKHSVMALQAVGLDIGAVDVKCTSSNTEKQDFIILEINSAPAFGEITLQKYYEQLNIMINKWK